MKISVEQISDMWVVSQSCGDSVWPNSSYPTARLAAARILQLLNLGPVAPQTHPEKCFIDLTPDPANPPQDERGEAGRG